MLDWQRFFSSQDKIIDPSLKEELLKFFEANSFSCFQALNPSINSADLAVNWQLSISKKLQDRLVQQLGPWAAQENFFSLFRKSYSIEMSHVIADKIVSGLLKEKDFQLSFHSQIQSLRQLSLNVDSSKQVFKKILNLLIAKTEIEPGWTKTFKSMFEEIFLVPKLKIEDSLSFASDLFECCNEFEDYHIPDLESIEIVALEMAKVYLKSMK